MKHAYGRNGRERNFVSVAGSFHLVQVLELGSLGLQTLGSVNFFAKYEYRFPTCSDFF
jgi:hypothetical protein